MANAGWTDLDSLRDEELLRAKEVQSKYEQPNGSVGLLAGGTENWQDVSANDVDRYGFIVKRNGARARFENSPMSLKAILRPSNKKLRAPQIVGLAAEPNTQREVIRQMKWSQMAKRAVDTNTGVVTYSFTRSEKLVERTFKGIPDAWRAAAWRAFLTDSAKLKPEFLPDARLEELYPQYLAQPSPYDSQIDLDVPRTIDSHVMFSARYRGGQRLLFRVLHAFSTHFDEIGYVQGMAPLAATFLSYYDEVACFIMMVRLFSTRHMDKLYAHGFGGLMLAFEDLSKTLNKRKVGRTLNKLAIEPTLYATKWYLTLFSYSVPFSTRLRIWDVFFLLGDKDLSIVHSAALTLVDSMRESLVSADFESAMGLVSHYVDVQNDDLFMNVLEYEYHYLSTRSNTI
ncbi:rab-GTPase-TBC domain-containing protein [Lipomyces arxii]|uniref:rab-GTPase-TBC domain-containing protein n=1 Tax=Lipomyces arxii TaxID=56418 RepID=UPI0034CF3AF5